MLVRQLFIERNNELKENVSKNKRQKHTQHQQTDFHYK